MESFRHNNALLSISCDSFVRNISGSYKPLDISLILSDTIDSEKEIASTIRRR